MSGIIEEVTNGKGAEQTLWMHYMAMAWLALAGIFSSRA